MISKKTYNDVWFAMDACNSSGVIHALDRWVSEVWEEARELGKGTEYVNSHPIVICVLDKLAQLARISPVVCDDSQKRISDAYAFVCDKTNEKDS